MATENRTGWATIIIPTNQPTPAATVQNVAAAGVVIYDVVNDETAGPAESRLQAQPTTGRASSTVTNIVILSGTILDGVGGSTSGYTGGSLDTISGGADGEGTAFNIEQGEVLPEN